MSNDTFETSRSVPKEVAAAAAAVAAATDDADDADDADQKKLIDAIWQGDEHEKTHLQARWLQILSDRRLKDKTTSDKAKKFFVLGCLHGVKGVVADNFAVEAAIEDFLKSTSQRRQQSSSQERKFVNIAFQVKETDMVHRLDVTAFADRVIDVYRQFYDNPDNKDNVGEKYIGPYFAFVQSSGMGKTKILFEFKQEVKKNNVAFIEKHKDLRHLYMDARLVLCRAVNKENADMEKEVYDNFVDFAAIAKQLAVTFREVEDYEKAVKVVHEALDKEFHDHQPPPLRDEDETRLLVLMLDEAHYLLDKHTVKGDDGTKLDFDAFLFRAVRQWISKIKSATKVVAVFTGTRTKLGNFKVESGTNISGKTTLDSRYNASVSFYPKGRKVFDPFFYTTTVGCIRLVKKNPRQPTTEYELSIPYGRPLFAVMDSQAMLTDKNLATIVRRMLHNENWMKQVTSLLSVLGTRVQMGQTTVDVASKLVGYAYANLTGIEEHNGNETARVCFMPDPVCARLAMCLMDENWSMNQGAELRIAGKSKKWWTGKVKEIYSQGLCKPEKGDLGEVMVALYFLFCADLLRQQADPDYKTFSVPLSKWVDLLGAKGDTISMDDNVQEPQSKLPKSEVKGKKEGTEGATKLISFGAIQVCRNYLRAYDKSWKRLGGEAFLENMYKSGIGFYVFAGCPLIDLVFSLRMSSGEGTTASYLPMFVSVKAHVTFSAKQARTVCDAMVAQAKVDAIGPALCLLVVFGSDESNTDDEELKLSNSCVTQLAAGNQVPAILRVPANDQFGLSNMFRDITTSKQEHSELFSSHSFVGFHCDQTWKSTDFAKAVLRSRPKADLTRYAKEMYEKLGVKPNNDTGTQDQGDSAMDLD
jgi:hypothetical protein